MRLLWIAAGWSSLVLGMIGAVLPVLPTTPFILLAAFCFARSSPRLHGWLLAHRQFGPLIRDWQSHGAIAPRVKRIAAATMLGCLVIAVLFGLKPWLLALQASVMAAVSVFIWTRPDGPRGG